MTRKEKSKALDRFFERLRAHKRVPHKVLPLPGGLWLGVNDVNVSVGLFTKGKTI